MDWLKLVLAALFTLVLGSYSFTSLTSGRLEDRIANRLDRIEDKLDKLISWGD